MRRKLTSIFMAIAMAVPITGVSSVGVPAPAAAQNWNCANGDWLACQGGNGNNTGYHNNYGNGGYSGAFNSRNRYNYGNNGGYNYGNNGGNSGGWNCNNGDWLGCNNGNNSGNNWGNRWGNGNNWNWNRNRDWGNNRQWRPRHGWRERHRDHYWRHQRRSDNDAGKAIVGGIIAGAASAIITGAILDAERRQNNLPPVGTYIPEKDAIFEGTAN